MKYIFTLALLIILCSANATGFTPNKSKDSLTCLTISGGIELPENTEDDQSNKNYKVELIYFNTLIDSMFKKDNRSFSFDLKKNSIYTIRISKPGYLAKLISINTFMEEENQNWYRFHFETNLLHESRRHDLDSESLEFPIALVEFNANTDIFYFNETYTTNIKKSLFLVVKK